jgi:zinc protease
MIKSRQLTPAQEADRSFLKALYGDHPYGHEIDGNEMTIAGIKQGDVYDFMRRLYIANDVSAVVVGNLPQARVLRSFKTFFGGWMKGQITPTTFRPPKQVRQLNLVKIEEPDAPQIEIRGGLLGVKRSDPDFPITEVMASILAARLRQEADHSSLNFSVRAEPRILPGPFFFTASGPADRAQVFSRRATELITALANTPVSSEELAAAKSTLTSASSAYPVEHYLREIEVYSLPRNYPEKIAPALEKITALDVQRVAKKLIDANALTVVVLGKVNDGFKSNL